MNMIAPIKGVEIREGIFSRLEALIAGQPASPDAARTETRQLVSKAIAGTCGTDNLWGAVDAFHAHYEFMMQTIEINGADDPNLRILRMRCSFYLEQVEALAQSSSYQ